MVKPNSDIMDPQNDKFKDECGVFGVFANKPMDVASIDYYGLYVLQHRGQESASIAVANGEDIRVHKGLGVLTEALEAEDLKRFREFNGYISIGYVRYSIAGARTVEDAQPLISSTKLGPVSTAHNGNLVNADVVKSLLEDREQIFHTSVDSEVITSLVARVTKKGIERAVIDAISAVRDSFVMVIMTKDKLAGIRDPHGIRPLCLGKFEEGYILTSEGYALNIIEAKFVGDTKPGEIMAIDSDGIKSYRYSENIVCQTYASEYIYFARPDPVIDGLDVRTTRIRQGETLFKEYLINVDIVVTAPGSGIPAVMGYAKTSGVPYEVGLMKNRYIGRTFISPSQEIRERAVAVKLNSLKVNIGGKRIILINDSIIRGITSKYLVESLRRADAKEAHFLIASPVVRYPYYFGIDIPYKSQLTGASKGVKEIRKMIGCDFLRYLSLEGMYESFKSRRDFCVGCFSGVYPVAVPMETLEGSLERVKN